MPLQQPILPPATGGYGAQAMAQAEDARKHAPAAQLSIRHPVVLLVLVVVLLGSILNIVTFLTSTGGEEAATPPVAPIAEAPTQPSAAAPPATGAASPTAPTASSTSRAAEVEYVVARGDTLRRIATAHGVTVAAIAERNGITNIDLIHVGTVLVIPAPPQASP
jgi:nucleoid-associated protein YgaU